MVKQSSFLSLPHPLTKTLTLTFFKIDSVVRHTGTTLHLEKRTNKGFIMEDVIFLIFGGWLDLTENERFLRKLFKIRNDQHYNTKLFCSQKVFPKPTICLIKHKIESENQIFGSRLLNRNMTTTSIIKPLTLFLRKNVFIFIVAQKCL